MANSPLVSIRIPPETLERIDQLAMTLYPARRTGKKPNRSQVILEAIEQFLEQHESSQTSATVGEELAALEQSDRELPDLTEAEAGYTVLRPSELAILGEASLPNDLASLGVVWDEGSPPTEEELNKDISSARKYIDWWLNYFSYVSKFTKPWFVSASIKKSS